MPVLKNPKHELFAHQVAKGVPLVEAYERAGYRPDPKNAAKLTKNHSVRTRIDEILTLAAQRTTVEIEEIVDELAKIAFSDIRKAVKWGAGIVVPDEEGNPQVVNSVSLIASHEIDDRTAAAISEISQTASGGLKIKFHDKRGALELLGKYRGMFIERHANLNMEFESLPDDQRRAMIAWLTGRLAEPEDGE